MKLQKIVQQYFWSLHIVSVYNNYLLYLANCNNFFAGQRIVNRLRQKIFGSIIQQETAFFDKNPTGELINRLSTDTTLVGKAITDNISDGLRALAQGAAGVSLMVNLLFIY